MIKIGRCGMCCSEEFKVLQSNAVEDPYYNLVNRGAESIQATWVKCKSCNFTYRLEQLEEEEMICLYKNYRKILLAKETPDQYFDRITGYPPGESENDSRSKAFGEQIDKRLEAKEDNRRHLDIGCGAGVFINSFNKVNDGWISHAIEATPLFAETASQRLGIEVYQGFYKAGIFKERFHLITILQVLEHVYEPEKMLHEIAKDLEDEGLLIIEVPSATNIGNLAVDHDMFTIPHYCLYSKQTLSTLLANVGFKLHHLEEFKLKKRETFQLRAVATVNALKKNV